MTTPTARPRRPRLWLWMVVGVLVVAIATGVGVFIGAQGQPDAPPTTAPTSPDSAGVNGCLGGTERDAATVVAAQQSAPHSTAGAVSYAATFSRWIYQIPVPVDVPVVADTNGLSAEVWDAYQRSAEAWSGPTPVVATTLTGRYDVIEASEDLVQVTLVLPWVVDGAVLPTRRFVPTLTLEWTGALWEVTDASGESAGSGDLANLGDAFEGGC